MLLPSLDRYLAALPDGLDSYPEALAKSAVVTPWRVGALGASLRACDEIPAPLRAILDRPLSVSDWVSEVFLDGLIEAALDVHFAGAGGAEALQQHIRATNRAVFTGPLYNVLFAVFSPARLLVGAAPRWSAFHQGSTLDAIERHPTRAVLELRCPPGLFSTQALVGHGTSFALAAELAGGHEVSMTHEAVSPRLTRYTITWS